MWLYSQHTGELWNPNGKLIATGYSGFRSGKNNPELEDIKNVGPIPKGYYEIGDPYDSENIGPFAIPLDPIGHDCLGRTYFRMHGDSRSNPGQASKGCTIFPRDIRQLVVKSSDKQLRVIE